MKFSRSLAAAAVIGLAFATGATAQAASGGKVGVLSCRVAPGVGLIIVSSKQVDCTFTGSGRKERYSGSTGKLGLDIGVTGEQFLTWAVFAAGSPKPGALAGTYVGATAQASAIVGIGANALVGGSNREFSLQPLSVQAQTGLDIAAGVSSITLRPGQ